MAKRRRARARPRRRGLRLMIWLNLAVAAVGLGWYAVQPAERRSEVNRLVTSSFEKNKRVSLLDVAWDIWQLYYSADFVAAPLPAERAVAYGGLPRPAGFPHGIRVLRNQAYWVGYCDALDNPVWAAYRVADVPALAAPAPRPERFEVDRRTVSRLRPEAYAGSGYDRGHLAPNYAIATRYGEAAQRETFLMSNVIPQRHSLNAGAWKELEMRVATSYPARFAEVWVWAGPIFQEPIARLPGGPAVPAACYMIIVDESEGRLRALAFIFPQETPSGADLRAYLVSIDEVEQRTGLDFFPEVEPLAQEKLESRRVERVW